MDVRSGLIDKKIGVVIFCRRQTAFAEKEGTPAYNSE